MSMTTFEATVAQGQIKLKNGIRLPDNIKVYVIVPDLQISSRPKLFSPRLAHPEQIQDFVLEVTHLPEEPSYRSACSLMDRS